jgi:hypothetical protein
MLRTMHATALVAMVAIASCAKTSDNSRTVTAPVVSGTSQPAAPPVASGAPAAGDDSGTVAGGDMMLGPGPADDDSPDAGSAPYRACQQDSDCIAVAHVGCCHNGWREAVNATQKDAYAKSFVCPTPHPMCPMYIVHDTRTPKCNLGTHLCTMVNAHP